MLQSRSGGLQSPIEIIGKTDYDFFPERAPEWESDDRRVMDSGVPKLNMGELVHNADGSAHWLRSKLRLK